VSLFFFFIIRPPLSSSLFPYTTLFRSFQIWMWSVPLVYVEELLPTLYRQTLTFNPAYPFVRAIRDLYLSNAIPELWIWAAMVGRSEEHTSELQSRGHLVCRLLLEKKKK